MSHLHTLLVLLTIATSGCGIDWKAINKPGTENKKPGEPPAKTDATAADLFRSTARMLEKGVFKDTDQMWNTIKSSAQTLDIDLATMSSKITENLGTIGENKDLSSDVDRRDWSAKFNRLADAVK